MAKLVLFQCTKKHDKVRLWAEYLRDAQVSGPVEAPGQEPACPTCKGPMATLSFGQWASLMHRPGSSRRFE